MSKPVHLRLSILELSKILMYEFWYDYIKLKCGKKVKLCYMDTDSFIVYIKTEHIYKDIPEDVETMLILQIMNYIGSYQKGKITN